MAVSFQGNSNNIATVDISAGFVGLNTYVEVPAMLLTAFATYAGPVLWAGHLVNFLSWEPSRCGFFSVPQQPGPAPRVRSSLCRGGRRGAPRV